MKDGTAYRHKESGQIYFYVCSALDCTTSMEGRKVAIYRYQGEVRVCEMTEFLEEFEEVME